MLFSALEDLGAAGGWRRTKGGSRSSSSCTNFRFLPPNNHRQSHSCLKSHGRGRDKVGFASHQTFPPPWSRLRGTLTLRGPDLPMISCMYSQKSLSWKEHRMVFSFCQNHPYFYFVSVSQCKTRLACIPTCSCVFISSRKMYLYFPLAARPGRQASSSAGTKSDLHRAIACQLIDTFLSNNQIS